MDPGYSMDPMYSGDSLEDALRALWADHLAAQAAAGYCGRIALPNGTNATNATGGECKDWCEDWDCGMTEECSGCDFCQTGGYCEDWCMPDLCEFEPGLCGGCYFCQTGGYCEDWCEDWECDMTECSGCGFCQTDVWAISSGSCTTDGACVMSPGWPGNYGNTEFCSITLTSGGLVTAEAFNTEHDYDYIILAGVRYEGSSGPHAVLPAGSMLEWFSDGSETRTGWRLCYGANGKNATNATNGTGCEDDDAWLAELTSNDEDAENDRVTSCS